MTIRDVNPETACGVTSKLPGNTLSEPASADKPSTERSSLINILINREAYARTSPQPGKTRTVDFYNVDGALYYADLPGYGYIKIAAEIKEKWGKVIEWYLRDSQMLKMVLLLTDIRHEPSTNDKLMYGQTIFSGYRPVTIATKLDKINRSQVQKHVKMVREGLGIEKDGIIIPFSVETKQGRDDIWDLIGGNLQAAPIPVKRELI